MPASGSGPGVIVVQEWWGLNSQIKGVADRLAGDGIKLGGEDTPPDEGVVIIRAHGVAPQVYDDLKTRGLRVMDGIRHAASSS